MAKVTVEQTGKGFEYWAGRPYLMPETQERVAAADVLLVPAEGHSEDDKLFPVATDELYAHLRDRMGDRFKIDLAIEDDDYKELSLHSVLLTIGTVVVASVAVPVLVNVLSEYINKKLDRPSDNEKAEVRVMLIIVDHRPTTLVHQTVNNQYTSVYIAGKPDEVVAQLALEAKKLPASEHTDGSA